MSRLTQNRWFRRFGFGAIAALSLGALVSTNPAQAHDYGDGYGYRAPVTHRAAFFSRAFFGFGSGYHHWRHWDHHWR